MEKQYLYDSTLTGQEWRERQSCFKVEQVLLQRGRVLGLRTRLWYLET